MPRAPKSPNSEALRLTVACGPVPCDSEEGRSFLQERLALFGKVGAILVAAHWISTRILRATEGSLAARWWTVGTPDLHYGLPFAVVFGVWLLCRGGRRSHGTLAMADTLSMFLLGCALAFRCAEATASPEHLRWTSLLALTNVILARAIVVPSTAAQTLGTGILASTPVVLGSYYMSLSPSQLFEDSTWAALCLATAAVASRIIYGLREEVREAREFGQYRIEEKIGSGAMGEVYRGSHLLLRRPTAIKLVKPSLAGERYLARFEREVMLTSQLSHPNTIAIYDYGRTPEGAFYYAMEYLDGVTLEELVELDGRIPPPRVIHILTQICGSLFEAHTAGLIHRDVKPANVILSKRGALHDFVKVLDFGLVKDIEGRADVTVSAANTITGTPLYMSPEAIRAPSTVDARSDLYAVGAVGYYLLTGEHVFDSTNFLEICSHHLQTRPVPPSERIGHDLPKDLEQLILLCLEKRPGDRPKNARSLRLALERCRDAGSWSEDDAALWWEKNGDRIARKRSRAQAQEAASSESEATETLEEIRPRVATPAATRSVETSGMDLDERTGDKATERSLR